MSELILFPTPLNLGEDILEKNKNLLNEDQVLIIGEERKTTIRKWLSWNLPREKIDNFIFLNEHNAKDQSKLILNYLLEKKYKKIILMSDAGLPVLCDPGRELVELCHRSNIKVSMIPIENSILSSLILSGFKNDEFLFRGFVPKSDRSKFFESISKNNKTQIIMETPYRLTKLLLELEEVCHEREICLVYELFTELEVVCRGDIKKIIKDCKGKKGRFVLIVGPKSNGRNRKKKA